MREEQHGKGGGKQQPVAEQGSVNKADMDKHSDNGKKKKKKKKKNGRGLRIALIVVLVLVLGIGGVIVAGLTVVKNTLDNVDVSNWIPTP